MEKDYMKSDLWGTSIWGIDERGKLYIGDGVAASLSDGQAPWEDYKDEIVEVATFGTVYMPKEASLAGLFKNCRNLVKVDLKDFNTTGVIDMSSMFDGCESLKEINILSFNTAAVLNMSRMFYGCKSLSNLDLSSFDTRVANNMTGMFGKCSMLYSVALSNLFSIVGNGTTSCGNLSIRDTGNYRIAKVVNAGSSSVVYNENYGRAGRLEKKAINGMKYTVEEMMFTEQSGNELIFTCWNTSPDGKGEKYLPGEVIECLDDDLELFAICVGIPKVGYIQALPEIEYGSPIPLELPEIISENDDSVTGHIEISATGGDGTWHAIDRNAILSASYNGFLVRLCAKNSVGEGFSNAVRIRIKKAGIDLSKVHWVESDSMVYDGKTKKVWLEGLPEEVIAVYKENEAIEVGEYNASVVLEYDRTNYSIPVKIRDHVWTIHKAQLDMSAVRWNYDTPFVYDGQIKEIRLTGLPDGLDACYSGNTSVDAGVMTATANLVYDNNVYEKPADVIPCVWEIKRAPIESKNLRWTDYADFVYDNTAKRVTLSNLPEDAVVEYSGEEEVLAGKYLARAILRGNYYATAPIEYEWEIEKAQYDMSEVKWTYTEPYVYDKTTHEVKLLNVPENLRVHYSNNVAQKAGDYLASASFTSIDTHNFTTPEDVTLLWTITKAIPDMSEVKWTYVEPFTYDGSAKSIELTGLPEAVFATYENNNATNAGVYTAHAILKYDEENYAVEQAADCQWQINKAKYDFSLVNWNYKEPFTYDGKEKTIALYNVPEGVNIEYKDNAKIDSGKYVATAKLTPSDITNYEVPEINGCTWSIEKFKLERGEIKWSDYDEFVYDGKEKTVGIISDISDQIRVEYVNNQQVNAGTYTARASFFPVDTHNYSAPKDATYEWKIKKSNFDMREVVWDYTSAFTYDGKKKTVQLLNVPEGLIVHYENSSIAEAGSYTAVARFEVMNSENYNDVEEMTLNWSIQKSCYNLENVKWQEEREFFYKAQPHTIELLGLPAGLEPVYSGNVAENAGEYIASVSFKYDENNYEKPSFESCRWKINKSDFNPGNARWDYSQPFIFDGDVKGIKMIDIPEGAYVEYSNNRATEAGVYIASAYLIAEDADNYNNIALDGITWRIDKGEYDMSYAYWDYEKPFIYDDSEKKIVLKGLPEGVFPIYQGNIGKDAGEYHAAVSFNVADSDNYNIPEFSGRDWTIEKADYDMSTAKWSYSGAFTYDGRMKEIILRGLPDGVRAIYDGNCATSAGSYKASAKLIPNDDDNYNVPSVGDCNWEIVKADYDMSAVRWDYTSAKIYNEREQGVELENLPNGIFAEYSGNSAVEVGKYSAKAQLRVADPNNYNTPAVGGCIWEIVQAEYDMSQIKWTYDPVQFVYDGKQKSVVLDRLPFGVEAKYSNNTGVDAGEYVAIAEFSTDNKNYRVPDSITFNWTIDKAVCDLTGVRWNYIDEFVYSGKAHGIQLENVPAVLNVAYRNNTGVDAGEYIAAASFIPATENYMTPEEMSCRWVINKANIDISKIRWDYDKCFEYDGGEKSIELAGLPTLLNVEYSGNIASNVGRYVAHADLYPVDEHNYNIPAVNDCAWEIIKTKYDMSSVKWVNDGPFTYDGDTKGVFLEGLPSGINPVYTDNVGVNVGKYNASVVFEYDEANYNEPKFKGCKWGITKSVYDMSNVSWSYKKPFVYDGDMKEIILEGLPEGLTPVYSGNRFVDAGVHVASVTFKYDELNYEKPKFDECKWIIEQAELAIDKDVFKWDFMGDYIYDGEAKQILLYEEGEEVGFMEKLRGKKVIYKLAGVPDGVEAFYEDNVQTDVGVYYAKAVLRHTTNRNYKEYIVPACRWEIKKATLDMSKVEWDYDSAFTYDGGKKEVKLINVPEQVNVVYENNIASEAGTYEAQATYELLDPRNYTLPTPIKCCWWHINKAKYDMSKAAWTYGGELVYDGKEKTVTVIGLPDGVKVEAYSGNRAIEAGSYTAEAVFNFKNKENYEAPEIPALRWRIQKKKIDTDEMRWTYDDSSLFVYDGKVKEVKLVGVPKDVELVYINNSKINAGNYIAKARLSYDTKNFDANPVPDCSWSIEKATIDTSKVHWSYERPFKYDAHEKSISLRNVPSQIDIRYRDNRASAVGTYTAKAYMTYDMDNYNPPEIDTTIDWEIIRITDSEDE